MNICFSYQIPVIQNKYRSYCESKRFKQSLNSGCASTTVTSSNRVLCENLNSIDPVTSNTTNSKEPTPNISGLKRTYSQATQNQAARKIQQFMLTAKNK